MKEIKVKPLDEDNKNGKMLAYIFLFQPILYIFAAIFIIFINIRTYEESLIFLIALGIFILLALYSFFINIQYIANGVLAEEICYIENKIFCYKKIRLNVFSLFKPRNSVEIETKEGKKYNIMNDFYLIGKNLQDNTTKVESREERAKKIFKEVKDLIMEAKNRNTFNF